MVSGRVRIALYPFAVATAAMPMPVLPLVGSMMVAPGFNLPDFSASSIIARAILSFTLPAGLKYSNLAIIFASFTSFFVSKFFTSSRGVLPMSCVALVLMFAMFLSSLSPVCSAWEQVSSLFCCQFIFPFSVLFRFISVYFRFHAIHAVFTMVNSYLVFLHFLLFK